MKYRVWFIIGAVLVLLAIGGLVATKVWGQDKCSTKYAEGTEVIITAIPCPGYDFTGWSGDCASCGKSRSCKVIMAADRTCKANFLPSPQKPRLLPPTNLQVGCNDVKVWR
jgi:uncharacterized repeat protein (TIGR02543 family)